MQTAYCLQRMLVTTQQPGSTRSRWTGYGAGELSESLWTQLDPALPTSHFARAFACGALTREDARSLKEAALAAGSDGELAYLAAAEGMAAVAARKLAGPTTAVQAESLRGLQECAQDYVLHRRNYLG